MAIIRPSVLPGRARQSVAENRQVKKHGGKANGRKGGIVGSKGGFGGKGGKGGFSGGKGGFGGGGQWMFVPAAPQKSFGKSGQFRGKGGQSFGKVVGGKGGAKGGKHANQNPKQKAALDKLGKIEADCKVWVGGLSKEVTRGKLHSHFKDSCKPHLFEIMSKGSACIAFKTAEDAQLAIDTFNGSELDGKDIQVDVWTKKEKKERTEGEPREKRQKKKKPVIKTSFLSGKKGKKPLSKLAEKIKGVDHALKAWVGGLSEKTTWKQLKQHFVDNGSEVDMCDMMKPGTACVTFKTEEEVSSAVGTANGTELDDKTIQVDVWTKPERKEKKMKKEEA